MSTEIIGGAREGALNIPATGAHEPATTGSREIHSLPYMPQLDSLRALAVLAVIYFHYAGPSFWPSIGIVWGALGVLLFFVLSGFLITSILLRDLQSSQSFGSAYGNFIWRRFLRLYPILPVVLLVGAALNLPYVRETLPVTLTYTYNLYAAATGEWHGPVSHLWTLAVEEQFYLVWPFLLFVCLRRRVPLVPVLVFLIVASFGFRVMLRAMQVEQVPFIALTPSSVDALALGALLALLRGRHRIIAAIGAVGLILWLIATAVPRIPALWHLSVFFHYEVVTIATAMMFVWVISRAADGFGGVVGKVLNSPALRYIGVISYGVYVFHTFTPYYLILLRAHWVLLPWQFNLLAAATTILLAALSWHLLERPIMRAGRKMLVRRAACPTVTGGEMTNPAPMIMTATGHQRS
jgi:peptidoglycan/LPS O-acetylase OafA/YrhL